MATVGFQRMPTKKLKIIHVLQGQYNEDKKDFKTVIGNVKRARIIATVIDKKFFSQADAPEKVQDTEQGISSRQVLTLDDGTGILRGINWNADESTYSDISVGDDVEVFGILKVYKERPQINLEIVTRIEDPNYELLRDLEIKKQIKNTPNQAIEEQPESPLEKLVEEPVEKGDIKSKDKAKPLKSPRKAKDQSENTEKPPPKNREENIAPEASPGLTDSENFNLKDRIYEIILTRDAGNGVSFEDIQEESQLDSGMLKSILVTLEKETAIGETRPGFYQPL